MNKYFFSFIGISLLLAASVAFFNVIVDPYGIYGFVIKDGFNSKKVAVKIENTRNKVHMVKKLRPKTIILGTSRIQLGLDPGNRFWPDNIKPVYNLAVANSNMKHALHLLRFSIAVSDIRRVVIGVDFSMFNSSRPGLVSIDKVMPVIPDNNYSIVDRFAFHIQNLLSYEASKASLETVTKQSDGTTQDFKPNGHRTPLRWEKNWRRRGHRRMFVANERKFVRRKAYIAANDNYLYTHHQDRLVGLEAFREMLRLCVQNKIQLSAIISPVHARQLEVIRQEGAWAIFEEWKRNLVEIIEEESVQNPNAEHMMLVDFTGYNEFTTEAVPQANSPAAMQWYWESQHFKSALGDKVIERLFQNNPSVDFGIKLDLHSIDEHLENIRQAAKTYRAKYHNELNRL